jgi:hypothetical protein
MGTASGGGAAPLMFTHVPQGIPFGLLVHDMVDRFLLYVNYMFLLMLRQV